MNNKLFIVMAGVYFAMFFYFASAEGASYEYRPTPKSKLQLVVNVGSKHFGGNEKYNEFNYGLGVNAIYKPRRYLTAGVYKNSYNMTTVYSGWGVKSRTWKGLSIGVEVLGVVGYPRGPFVAPIPNIRFGHLKMLIMPAIEKGEPNVLGFQLEF